MVETGQLTLEQKRELLRRLLDKKKAAPDHFPLSLSQLGVWHSFRFNPDAASDHLLNAYRFKGSLNMEALRKALVEITARHDSLRATFAEKDGEVVQQPAENVDVVLAQRSLKELDPHVRETEAGRIMVETVKQPFDLTEGPLFRFLILEMDHEDRIFAVMFHHIVADNWAFKVFNRELSALYSAFVQGRPSPLPPLKRRFRDWVNQERKTHGREQLKPHLDYWKKQLAGLNVTELPTDFSRPAVQTFNGARFVHGLDREALAGLDELVTSANSSRFTAFLTAFLVLLWRLTGNRDVSIGVPVANRDSEEWEHLIAFFVNTLVMRQKFSEESSYRRVLQQGTENVLEAYDHARVSFHQLIDALNSVRDPSRNPLAPIVFQMGMLPELELENLRVEKAFEGDYGIVRSDLECYVVEEGTEARVVFIYNRDLFEENTIADLAARYEVFLRGCIRQPDSLLKYMPLLKDSERSLVLDKWNATERVSEPTSLVAMLRDQVERTPHAPAVIAGERRLTYAELDRAADRSARRLLGMGTTPESVVGICASRSLEQVVALFGVLKAGAAYCPLDPTYPDDRLTYMAADSGMKVLLTQSRLSEKIALPGLQIFLLDEATDRTEQEKPGQAQLPEVDPQSIAYVIYTSGTTGKPKGVAVPHAGICNTLRWRRAVLPLNADDRVLQTTSFSFDASVWEFFGPLVAGASLDVSLPIGADGRLHIPELVRKHKITAFQLPPSWLKVFLEEADLEALTGLRMVITGAEPVSRELQQRLFSRLGASFHNLYGPTEASLDVTAWTCRADDTGAYAPIGKPIHNVRVYVFDANLNPLPVKQAGEMFIGGAGLARGYLNQPALTAERFIPDPFGPPGARLYRTGDLVAWRPDGELKFLGRVDNQVKIRGFRIELGEIEAALRTEPLIEDVAVTVKKDAAGTKRLIAYVVPAADPAPNWTAHLQQRLGEQLPDYMVPAAFVTLSALPLLSNGKLDLQRLPEPNYDEDRPPYVAPRSDAEAVLARIWENLLQVERVGVHDRFFHLGGDSILAIQVVAAANRKGLKIQARQVFQTKDLAELAARADTRLAEDQGGELSGKVPLSPIQNWFFDKRPAHPNQFNQAFLLKPGRRLVADTLQKALLALVKQHDGLRLRFQKTAEGWQQFYSPLESGTHLALHTVDLSNDDQPDASLRRHEEEAHGSLDITNGPVGRVVLFDSGPDRPQQLLLTLHHLVVDGYSWRVLLEDLGSAYEQAARGEETELGLKTTSWRDWSLALDRLSGNGALDAEKDYWKNLPVAEPLQADSPRGSNLAADEQTCELILEEDLVKALDGAAHHAYGTRTGDFLFCALAQALQELRPGQTRVSFETEGHGREGLVEDLDVSRTLGWFTSLYPVCLQLKGADPGEQLATVKQQLRDIPNNGLGFGVLRYLATSEGSARTERPGSAVLFNYLGRLSRSSGETDLFPITPTSGRGSVHPRNPRFHELDIYGLEAEGRMVFHWRYSKERLERSRVERLAERFAFHLRSLVDHCLGRSEIKRTPADFPLAELDQARLDELLVRYPTMEDIYPMTAMQQGMVFHSLYEPESQRYIQQISVGLRGTPDLDAYQEAWQAAARRFAIMRTVFAVDQASPLQVVCRDLPLDWQVLDWRYRNFADEAARERALTAYFETERAQGFTPGHGSPQRIRLILAEKDLFFFVWTHHHALLDGWSLPILLGEVSSVYQSLLQGKQPKAVPARAYRDYLEWLTRSDREAARTFWRERLGDFEHPNQILLGSLPAEEKQGQCNSDRRFSPELTKEIMHFAKKQGVTLATVLQAAWATLLGRYSGRDDVVFGITTAGRPAELTGSERMVGLFINTLPMRVDCRPGRSITRWLQDIHHDHAALLAYEATPLVEAQAMSGVDKGSPLFDSILVFENYPLHEAMQGSWTGFPIDSVYFTETVEYSLVLQVIPGEELVLKFKYNGNRFSQAVVRRMQNQLEYLIGRMVEEPGQDTGSLELLSTPEKHYLLHQLNDTDLPYRAEACMHELFEEACVKTPAAVALMHGGQSLTYEELNRQANQLAHHLIELGVVPNQMVGVSFKRGFPMVAALLGILKAGGAYVPMDTFFPRDRVRFILENTRAELLLTESSVAELFGDLPVQTLCLDKLDLTRYPAVNPPPRACSDDLAYIIFTSGSTGRPKGVILQHRPVINLIEWVNQTYAVGADDRLLFITSLCFDLSVYDIFGILAAGGQVFIASDEDIGDPESLSRILDREGITFWDSAPAALQQLTAFFPAEGKGSPDLRLLFLSGDWIPLGLQPAVVKAFPNARLIGLGGATEAAIWSNFFPVHRVLPHWNSIPYGLPIQNAHYHVLDDRLRPCPVGVPGDLYIGHRCLSRGYWGQPKLTAVRYLPNPYATDERYNVLYTTGDRARRMEDGHIEFLGRLDAQVKIRGYRVELGEVESVLLEHDRVRGAAAMVREDHPGNRLLVAYVLADPETQPEVDELKEHMGAKLAPYMIPAAFVFLPQFPVTGNGKLDRKALPAPQLGSASARQLSTPLEKAIASVWSEVLGVANPDPEDNFFNLGGHSLLATTLATRLAKEKSLKLSLRDIFEQPTIRRLAAVVSRNQEPVEGPELIPVTRTGAMPLSFAQQRLWYMNHLQPDSHLYNMFFAIEVDGPLHEERLQTALNRLTATQESLRTRIVTERGEGFQHIDEPRDFPLEIVDLSREPEAAVTHWLREVAATRFDLGTAPLFRAVLLHVNPQRSYLLIVFHHIIFDGVSIGLFLDGLTRVYSGQTRELEAPDIQYADYAVWERRRLESGEMQACLDYWRDRLGGAPRLKLPYDRLPERTDDYMGAGFDFEIDESTTRKARAFCEAHNCSMFMLLLSTWNTLLSRLTGQTDIVMGTDNANRYQAELEHVIGFFINLLAVRCDLSGDPTFEELVARVHTGALEAYEHGDVPFDKLVSMLTPEGRDEALPIIQALLVMMQFSYEVKEVDGHSWTMIPPVDVLSKFEIAMYVDEAGERLRFSVLYRTDRFENGVQIMLQKFTALLTQVLADPKRRLSDYEVAGEEERERRDRERLSHKQQKGSALRKARRRAASVEE
ncbi:MAG: amino acid adenylation domain-containing protein [Acidobacteriota bacterium]|nr:amino acid adenylation domain-containing protein [Acidobacteriota bacterium]